LDFSHREEIMEAVLNYSEAQQLDLIPAELPSIPSVPLRPEEVQDHSLELAGSDFLLGC
jgi:hypothetical protein